MNIKLEAQRGGTVHCFDVAPEATPPDVVFWDNRVFRYLRTDGVWDQKKHVYREASARALAEAGDALREFGCLPAPPQQPEHAHAEASTDEDSEEARKISLSLTANQADMLKRVRSRGGYASNKSAILAGLEALERASALTNEALLTLLARRLRGTAD